MINETKLSEAQIKEALTNYMAKELGFPITIARIASKSFGDTCNGLHTQITVSWQRKI